MLELEKPLYDEGHSRILALRAAIERGHQLRSDNTEPGLLVTQTERNIANKEKVIDKSTKCIAELKLQRDDIDKQLAAEEAKVCADSQMLETFKQRLQVAKERQRVAGKSAGIRPSTLDPQVGQPTLRTWLQHSFTQVYEWMEELEWDAPIPKKYAESYSTWKTAVDTIEGFARYAGTKVMADVHHDEAEEARRALRNLLDAPGK